MKNADQISLRVVSGGVLIFLGVLFLSYSALMCFIFRDGMGPDAVTSHGFEAFKSFLDEFSLALVIALPICALGIWMVRPALKRNGKSSA